MGNRTFRTNQGSRSVVTYVQDGFYMSRLWVNCTDAELGTATLTHRNHTTEKGARRWAGEVLAR
jgi:hypothetical protein